jgi:N-glycosylase/DNA lyase
MRNDRRSLKKLHSEYRKIRPQIANKLSEFRRVVDGKNEKIFSELSYCILTANANAMRCAEAVRILEDNGLLLSGKARQIAPILKGRARFHNKKADYIVGARNVFINKGCLDIKGCLNMKDIPALRDWLVENIKGFGYKEASHFLRNIGLGEKIAILDRHILRNLKRWNVIDKIPGSVGNRKVYMDIEDKMRSFSRRAGIPMGELDLLFWAAQTGFVFK